MLAVLFLGLAVRLLVFMRVYTPDSFRFVDQARSMVAGEGFSLFGEPCTSLAPGYPVLLSCLMLLRWDWEDVLFVLHMGMSLGSCLLVYLAVRPYRGRLALAALTLLAFNPWVARLVGYVLSETLSVFLGSLLVYLFSNVERSGGRATTCLLAGVACVGSVLTAPSTVFLAFGVWCVLAWRLRRRVKSLMLLVGGSLLLMIPWQVHVYRATGHVQPMIFTPAAAFSSEWGRWIRTWLLRQRDMWVWWHPDARPLPVGVVNTKEELVQLTSLLATKGTYPSEDAVAFVRQVTDRRIAEDPVRFYLLNPVLRAVMLWFEMPQLAHLQMEYVGRFTPRDFVSDSRALGLQRAGLRLCKATVSTVAYILYVMYPILFIASSLRAVRAGRVLPVVILLGTVAYTVISSYYALGEWRRNSVFYPALLFQSGFLARRQTHELV